MPQPVKIYASFFICAGAAALAAAGLEWNSQSPKRFLICLMLALLGATFKVTLPGLNSSISPSFVPIFLALGAMSWQETVVIAGLAGIVQSAWRPKQRPNLLQVLFNGATLALASGSAYAVSHTLATQTTLGLFILAATVFQVVNVLIVSGVLSLAAGDTVRGIWRNCHFWSYPYHLVGAAFAAVLAQTEVTTAVGSAAVICAVMLYLLSSFFGELVKRATSPKTA